jgi:hypothetical protein
MMMLVVVVVEQWDLATLHRILRLSLNHVISSHARFKIPKERRLSFSLCQRTVGGGRSGLAIILLAL